MAELHGMRKLILILIICILGFCSSSTFAADRVVTICTQNLFRLGEKDNIKSPQFEKQMAYLIGRIKSADCDFVGLQEVAGKNIRESEKIIATFTSNVSRQLNKDFEYILSKSNDNFIRNGALVSKDNFYIEHVENWNHNVLPKLDIRSAPWSYSRGPLVIKLKLKNSEDRDAIKELYIVNDHLKSKSRGWKDNTNTNYEFARLLSAAGIKESMNSIKSSSMIEVFLGDRNSGESSATAQLLQGRLDLDNFRRGGSCEVSTEGSALCPQNAYKKPDMIPLVEFSNTKRNRPLATFKMGRKEEILDEIYVYDEDKQYVEDRNGRLAVGVEGEFRKGSDHLLSWVRLSIK